VSARRLDVYLHARHAGVLIDLEPGAMAFDYDPHYLRSGGLPLSISLPPIGTATPTVVRNWFTNLLPEGDARMAVCSAAGIPLHDDFGLLEAIGRECAGAVALWPTGVVPPPESVVLEFELLDHEQLEAWIQSPRRRGLGKGLMRLSLAGAQHKAPVIYFEDGSLALPSPASPSTHILKIPNPELPGVVTLEALAMRALAAAGLHVAHVRLVPASSPCLLIARYDRSAVDGVPQRLHQEDVCQALGISSESKYAEHGGPTLSDVFALVRTRGSDPKRLMELTRRVAANAVLANADVHGKNISLLLERDGTATLAPAYDVVPSGLFADIDRTLAMPIGNATTLDDIRPDDWGVFAEQIGMRQSLVRSLVTDTAIAIAEVLSPVAERLKQDGGNTLVIERAVPRLIERANAIATGQPLPPALKRRRKIEASDAWQ